MKKIVMGLALVTGLLLVGCASVEDPSLTDSVEDGILVTVGFDKSEWYLSPTTVTVNENGRTVITLMDDTAISTNDIVNEYPYRDDEHLKELLEGFDLE